MNEPKRRGRPPKARSHVDPPAMKVTTEHASVMTATDAERHPWGDEVLKPLDPSAIYTIPAPEAGRLERAQAYAMRVWSGQSPDVNRAEKIRRCAEALKDQNLPTEGVEYPE